MGVLTTALIVAGAGALAQAGAQGLRTRRIKKALDREIARTKPKTTQAQQWQGDASAEKAIRDAGARGGGVAYGSNYQDALARLAAGRQANAAALTAQGNAAAAQAHQRKGELMLEKEKMGTGAEKLLDVTGQAAMAAALPTIGTGIEDQYDFAKQKRSGVVNQQYAKTMAGEVPPPNPYAANMDEYTMDRLMGRSPYSGFEALS